MKSIFLTIASLFLFGNAAISVKADDHKPNQVHTLDLLIVYPDEISTQIEMTDKMNQIVREANQVYLNSDINIRLRVVEIMPLPFTKKIAEQMSGLILNCQNMAGFENTYPFTSWYEGSPYANQLRIPIDQRKNTKADIVLYVDYPQSGVSSSGKTGIHNAYVKIAISELSTHKYLHELGHDLGLTHEMGASIPYNSNIESVTTIMAVNCANFDSNMKPTKKSIELFSGEKTIEKGQKIWSRCNWNCRAILNENAYDYSQWGERIAAGELYVEAISPKNFIDISLTENCHAWGLDTDYRLFQWNGYKWSNIPQEINFTQLEARRTNKVYLVDYYNNLYSYKVNDDQPKIQATPEKVKKFSIGPDGDKWMIGTSGMVYQKINGNWELRTGKNRSMRFSEIDVQSRDKLWSISLQGNVYRWNKSNNDWKLKTTILAKDIGAGKDGTIVITSLNNDIYIKYPNEKFKPIPNNVPAHCNCSANKRLAFCDDVINHSKAHKVNVYNKDFIWVLSAGNKYTYKYVGKNGFQWLYGMDQTRVHLK